MVRGCGVGVGVEEGVAVCVDVGAGVREGVLVSVEVPGGVAVGSGGRISTMLPQDVVRRRKTARVTQCCSVLPTFMTVTSAVQYGVFVKLDTQNVG